MVPQLPPTVRRNRTVLLEKAKRKAATEVRRKAKEAKRQVPANKVATVAGDGAPKAMTPMQKRIEQLERRVRAAERRAKAGRNVQAAALTLGTSATSLHAFFSGSTVRFLRTVGGDAHKTLCSALHELEPYLAIYKLRRVETLIRMIL